MNHWLDKFPAMVDFNLRIVNSQLRDEFLTRLYERCLWIYDIYSKLSQTPTLISFTCDVWSFSLLCWGREVPESGLSGSAPSRLGCRCSVGLAAGWWRDGFPDDVVLSAQQWSWLSALRTVGFGTAGKWCRLGSNEDTSFAQRNVLLESVEGGPGTVDWQFFFRL